MESKLAEEVEDEVAWDIIAVAGDGSWQCESVQG